MNLRLAFLALLCLLAQARSNDQRYSNECLVYRFENLDAQAVNERAYDIVVNDFMDYQRK